MDILIHTYFYSRHGHNALESEKRISYIEAHDTLTRYVVSNLDCAGMDLRVGKAWTETRHMGGGAREVGTRT